jgi:hypothetical protein
MLNVVQNYQKTNYPDLFRQVYWGRFEYSNLDESIIENRNSFIESNNITAYYNYCFDFETYICDITNIEFYASNNAVFMIFSGENLGINMEVFIKAQEFNLIDPLYSTKSKTYLKKFDDWTDVNIWTKSLELN